MKYISLNVMTPSYCFGVSTRTIFLCYQEEARHCSLTLFIVVHSIIFIRTRALKESSKIFLYELANEHLFRYLSQDKKHWATPFFIRTGVWM